jgi:transcription elongation GreA/GreB family factor
VLILGAGLSEVTEFATTLAVLLVLLDAARESYRIVSRCQQAEATIHFLMTKKLIVSRSSLQSLADKHDLHASQKRTAQREAKVAKEWGDLSENAEYKASKEKFRLAGRIQQRLVRELKKLEDTGYEVVDPLDWVRGGSGGGRVEVGTVARVLQAGVAEDYLVVGAKDQNLPLDQAVLPLPYTSPLGQALYGLVAPQSVEAVIAGERRVLWLESVRLPEMEEVLALYPELTPQKG